MGKVRSTEVMQNNTLSNKKNGRNYYVLLIFRSKYFQKWLDKYSKKFPAARELKLLK